jgi:hypothetical protein
MNQDGLDDRPTESYSPGFKTKRAGAVLAAPPMTTRRYP